MLDDLGKVYRLSFFSWFKGRKYEEKKMRWMWVNIILIGLSLVLK